MKPDGMPRLVNRKPGDGKKKAEAEDILNYFVFADEKRVGRPTFVASNIDRVPTVAPGDADVYALAAAVVSLTTQGEMLSQGMESAASMNDLVNMNERLGTVESAKNLHDFAVLVSNTNPVMMNKPTGAASSDNTSWSKVASGGPGDFNKRQTVAIRVRGSGTSNV